MVFVRYLKINLHLFFCDHRSPRGLAMAAAATGTWIRHPHMETPLAERAPPQTFHSVERRDLPTIIFAWPTRRRTRGRLSPSAPSLALTSACAASWHYVFDERSHIHPSDNPRDDTLSIPPSPPQIYPQKSTNQNTHNH